MCVHRHTQFFTGTILKLSQLGVGRYRESLFVCGWVPCVMQMISFFISSCTMDIAAKLSIIRCLPLPAFNAKKNQLIRFSSTPSIPYSLQHLLLSSIIVILLQHYIYTILGHTLKFNLCDDEDVLIRSPELVKKANHFLVSFSDVGSDILSCLFRSFSLSLYRAAMWTVNCPAIKSL